MHIEKPIHRKYIDFLRISVLVLFLGKGLLHLMGTQPYDILFINGTEIQIFFGVVLLLSSLFLMQPNNAFIKQYGLPIFYIGSFIIAINSYASFAKVAFLPEQLVECALQIGLPIVFIHAVRNDLNARRLFRLLCILIAATFIGHAIYAIGYHLVPANFLVMTTQILKLTETEAVHFLFTAGVLDIVCAVFVFIPVLRKYAIWYLICWGFLTAIARVYSIVGVDVTFGIFVKQLFETVYRIPHGLVPFLVWVMMKEKSLGLVRLSNKRMRLITRRVIQRQRVNG